MLVFNVVSYKQNGPPSRVRPTVHIDPPTLKIINQTSIINRRWFCMSFTPIDPVFHTTLLYKSSISSPRGFPLGFCSPLAVAVNVTNDPRASGSPAPRWCRPRGVCRAWRGPPPPCTSVDENWRSRNSDRTSLYVSIGIDELESSNDWYVYIYIFIYLSIYIYMYIIIYIYTYVHIYIYTHMYMYIYIYIKRSTSKFPQVTSSHPSRNRCMDHGHRIIMTEWHGHSNEIWWSMTQNTYIQVGIQNSFRHPWRLQTTRQDLQPQPCMIYWQRIRWTCFPSLLSMLQANFARVPNAQIET